MKLKRPAVKDSYFTVYLTEAKLGLAFRGVRVKSVVPKGWADKNKIVPGDEILLRGDEIQHSFVSNVFY